MMAGNIIYWAAHLSGSHISKFKAVLSSKQITSLDSLISLALEVGRNAWEERTLVKIPEILFYRVFHFILINNSHIN